ncbi:MAG: hypothetical protein LBT99_03155, partial [Bifidobacteriaceae bacterium]|nr:hypothetical protein [Bifidobacteriaceae bacterium]
DIEVFHPDRIAGRILNMGDILSLIEKAENTMSEDQADKLAKKIIGGQGFDFNDFLIQMEQLKKMGSIKQLASLIPGFSQHKQALNQIDDSQITVFTSIVQSMTPFERANPKQINGARRIRIAKGSGRSNREINNLLDRFKAMSKMMKNMAGGKPMSDADFPNQAITPDNLSDQLALQQAQQSGQPMPFGSQMLGGKVKKKSKNHKKKKFGNPAKQAAWEQQHK